MGQDVPRSFQEAIQGTVDTLLEFTTPGIFVYNLDRPELDIHRLTKTQSIDSHEIWYKLERGEHVDLEYYYKTLAMRGAVGYMHSVYAKVLDDFRVYPVDVANTLRSIAALVVEKQRDYGTENILFGGHHGIVLRVNDKIARAKNLTATVRDAANEPLHDTFRDWGGYALVGLMLLNGTFTLPLVD